MESVLLGLGAVAAVALVLWLWHSRSGGRPREGGGRVPAPRVVRGRGSHQKTMEEPQTRFLESHGPRKYTLLNDSEQMLYQRLVEAMPNMIVFAQVGLAQLAQLRGRQAMAQLQGMAGRGVDFVVCRDDFSILAAIELTWPTPPDDARHQAEEAKRLALESLGVPLIVFRPNQLPDVDIIGREIAEAILRRNRLEAERARALETV